MLFFCVLEELRMFFGGDFWDDVFFLVGFQKRVGGVFYKEDMDLANLVVENVNAEACLEI